MEKTEFINKITPADPAVCEKADSFLQSAEWGQLKSRFGWRAYAFLLDWADCPGRPLLVLSRVLAPVLSFAYVPWGPQPPENFQPAQRLPALGELAQKLKSFLPRNTAFIRFDPPWFVEDDETGDSCQSVGRIRIGAFLRRAAADIQPPDTVLVDLQANAEDILASMKPKWRYNIGLAEKRKVSVEKPDEQGLDFFYALLRQTAARDGIAIHSIEYYRAVFEIFKSRVCLYTASHEGDPLAAIVVLRYGNVATYLYGASSDIKRNLMAPYALQWRAMREAKEAGCVLYDLFGIPPNEDPNHPMAGLYRFKTGFGGKIVRRPGSWDYPYNPLMYGLFNTAEGLRKKIRDLKKR